MNGFSSCWEVVPPVSQGSRTETEIKRRGTEKKIKKLLRNAKRKHINPLKITLIRFKN